MAGFLVVHRMGCALATSIARVKQVDGFFAKAFRYFLQRRWLFATKEEHRVAVANNRFSRILVDGFQLALGLQDNRRGDFTGANGRDQFVEHGDRYSYNLHRISDAQKLLVMHLVEAT